ncbi:membrane protein [Burkholderiaceae bacterium 16]|nr:membrane protein [Burkholderiaceae bacterium 16]
MPSLLHRWRPVLLTLLLGLAAALLCTLLHTPLPWMIGPLLAVATARMRGADLRAPTQARNAGQWAIGTSLGLYFTSDVVGHLLEYLPYIVAGSLFALVLGCGGAFLLRRSTGVAFKTAYFSTAIGGASEMANLAERNGARIDQVAAAHSLRVLMVVVAVPALFQYGGIHGLDPYIPGPRTVDYLGLLGLIAITVSVALVLKRFNLPNPFVIGTLLAAAVLTASGVELSAIPTWMSRAGQLLIGVSLGARFSRDFLHTAPRFLTGVALYTLVALVLSALFGWALSALSGVHPATAILGTTPGGIAEMCITAKVLELGVPLVTAFHVIRMAFVVLCTGPLYHWLKHRAAPEETE